MKWNFYVLFLGVLVCLQAQQTAPGPAAAASQAPASIASTASVPPDTVVISVGDNHITAAEFNSFIELLPEQNRTLARSPAGRKQFGDSIVRLLVLADEGKRRKLDESPAFKAQAEFQTTNLLAGRAYTALGKPTDEELNTYYEAHKADFEEVRARHILIRAKGSPMPGDPNKKELTEEEALAKAQELRKKIMAGADFAQVATEESDDTSRTAGGDLNFFRRGQMVPPFEQAAFALKVGDVSEPVKSPFGYHLIKVEAKKEQTLQDAKPEIERKLGNQKAGEVIEEMTKKASVTLNPQFFGPPAPASPAPPANAAPANQPPLK